MNDYETIITMLNKANITYVENEEGGSQPLPHTICKNIFIYVDEQKDERRIGWKGFITEIIFDEYGNLVTVGAWE